MRRSATETREHVLAVARDLFYWHGIRSTGVDAIALQAQVATTTLYRLFPNKDALVAAYVEREAAGYRAWFSAAIADASISPRERILAVFEALAEQVQPDHCRGCPFQMAMAELADPALPGHAAAVAVKVWTQEQMHRLATELLGATTPSGRRHAAALGDQLLLVLEGVYASVQSLGNDGPASRARALVEQLTSAASTTGDSLQRQPSRTTDHDSAR